MPELSLTSTVEIAPDVHMPRFGLGVFRAGSPGAAERAVTWALDAGYRHIDTARIYRNEREVGRAIAASELPRDEVFVTTKLWNDDHDDPREACLRSLGELGLEAVDLYLIHWPVPGKRIDAWRAMIELRDEGYCRAIGVSNFTIRHLDALIDATGEVPAVNQVELHPWLTQDELVAHCRDLGIVVEAYSPLTKGRQLRHAELWDVAQQVARTPAQVLIRWSLQKGFVSIPKSSNQGRIAENAQVFDFALDDAQMAALDGLDENLRTAWDPTEIE